MAISFYNASGKITSELTGDKAVIDLTKELTTDLWVEGAWFNKPFYVVDDEVLPQPENPTVLVNQTLTNVPVPATVIINGISYETNEAQVELGFTQPGTYTVKVIAWPYLDKEFVIENPA